MTKERVWKLGLVGSPIAHSRSPSIHEAALLASGLRGDYALFEREKDSLSELVESLRVGSLHGLNVTIPHKERVIEACDKLDSLAELVGAVNTLVIKNGAIWGYNTDVTGLELALMSQWPEMPWRGRRCTVVGAGGAARAACVALKNLGAAELFITNRTHQRAELLAQEMSQSLRLPCEALREAEAFEQSRLVIQATSLGVHDTNHQEVSDWAASLMARTAPGCVVMDLVYAPVLPPFARGAIASGRDAIGGLGMLVYQAQQAFRLWTGYEVAPSLLLTAAV